ncbi:XRE family transcriptional regulator [Streptomyces albireticuli]|uniref:XRE family transcriptional regulator n=1 Tax=Streptomyces albireticuli TaxID=1940 RepID=A0A1Z2L6X4_9ACTN|nr:tetratricopeptide repeat protein [Streptomyces albireticuli]ARZ70049.1 XRE family transcriptional regulator [Streptomyces albireticuli]
MDPFTMAAVLTAVETATSGALSGAAGEMGRRTTEGLAGLVRRMWRRGDDPGGDPASPADPAPDATTGDGEGRPPGAAGTTGAPAVPTDAGERRALAALLIEQARREPVFARDLEAWLREAALVGDTARATRAAVPAAPSRPRLLPPGTAAFTDREHVLTAVMELLDGTEEEPDVYGRAAHGSSGPGSSGPGQDPSASGAHAGDAYGPVGAPRVVLLTGPGGIGKTATAVHCARALSGRFPDGELYADLRGATASGAAAPSGALVRFLHGLGVPPGLVPADEREQTDLYRDRTAGRRMVVVLDNAHSAAQVAPLLTASPGSLVLVTSRHRLPELVRDHGARPIRLGPLSGADSVRLLTRLVGRERFAAQRTRAEAVTARCGGIPLALCETGARVAVREHLSWETLEREFAAAGAGMPDRRGDGAGDGPRVSPPDPVQLTTDLSYRDLAPEAARLYRLLGLCPWPEISVGAAAAAADVPEAEARALLDGLAGVHLLEEVGEERYRFHDAVRRHAERRAHAEDGRTGTAAAVRRTVTWYLRFAAGADARVIPGRWHLGPAYDRLPRQAADRAPEAARAALAELRRERENLAEAVRAAEEYGFDELAWQLCEAMWGLHLRLGFHEQWIATHLRGVAAARRAAAAFGDPRAEGRMRTQLAFAYMGLARPSDAEDELTAAAAADQRAGHRRGQATAVESLGLLCLRQWRYEDAGRHFRQARSILSGIAPGEDGEADVPRALALLEHHLGRALRGQGDFAGSVDRLRSALALFEALPLRDRYNEARVRTSLAETFLAAGDPTGARAPLDEALAVLEAEGALLHEADATELRARCGTDRAEETRFLEKARRLYERAGDAGGVERVTARLGEAGRGR